jgi:hypothetical protein
MRQVDAEPDLPKVAHTQLVADEARNAVRASALACVLLLVAGCSAGGRQTSSPASSPGTVAAESKPCSADQVLVSSGTLSTSMASKSIDVAVGSTVHLKAGKGCAMPGVSEYGASLISQGVPNEWMATTPGDATLIATAPMCNFIPVASRSGCAGGLAKIAELTIHVA